MAVTQHVYANASLNALSGVINYPSDTIYIALVTAAYTPNQSTDAFWAAVVANEVANGNGYVTNGKLLGTKTLAVASLVATIGAANPAAWTASSTGFAAAYAVIYDRTPGTDATRPLIAYIDFGATKTLVATDTLTVTFNASGIGTWTVS